MATHGSVLKYLQKVRNLCLKLIRWDLKLQKDDFEVFIRSFHDRLRQQCSFFGTKVMLA